MLGPSSLQGLQEAGDTLGGPRPGGPGCQRPLCCTVKATLLQSDLPTAPCLPSPQLKNPPWLPSAWNQLHILGCLWLMEELQSVPEALTWVPDIGHIQLSGESSGVSSDSHKKPPPHGLKSRLLVSVQCSLQAGLRSQHLPLLVPPRHSPPSLPRLPSWKFSRLLALLPGPTVSSRPPSLTVILRTVLSSTHGFHGA